MKILKISARCKTVTVPHLCPGDNAQRAHPLGPPYREFRMDEGLHTICCDGCGEVYQFKVVKPRLH